MSVWHILFTFLFGAIAGSTLTVLYDIAIRRAKDRGIEKEMNFGPIITAIRERNHAERE